MPTVHVTGHHNKQETKEIIDSLPSRVVIGWYHGMYAKDFKEISGDHKTFIPEIGKTYYLEEILDGS